MQLIYVKWVDSAHLAEGGWTTVDEIVGGHDEQTACESVGWLAHENEHSLYLAGSLAPEEVGSVMQIPRCAVLEQQELLVRRLSRV